MECYPSTMIKGDMSGCYFFTDCHNDVWRLVPTGDPSCPITIFLEERNTSLKIFTRHNTPQNDDAPQEYRTES